ncbi:uncharacterized protein LOC133291697 [Gastrolobium bilobum]|uniref:uncharacterized protein LOC133291697 n=1 Tax=Gastrolobium bilobum TaxID=150636 RepID=UPI002AB0B8E5|nr:uncharacterized protein LOC133291697 [Gastrolobium bilobum]
MEEIRKQQICHKLCSNMATFLLVLVLFSVFFFFSVSVFSPSLLTLLITLLSTMFLVILTKKKGSPHENLVQDNLQKSEIHPSLGDVTQTEATQQGEIAERQEQQAEAQSCSSFPLDSESSNIMDKSFELTAQMYEQQSDPQSDSSFPSDSESSTDSIISESFEIDHNRTQNLGISDSLASDNDDDEEDGLIEIKLPSGHFSGLTEDPNQKLESNFYQQGLRELLAEINEMNEDENLIEIDISMGSTKYQDLRLKELAYLGDQSLSD